MSRIIKPFGKPIAKISIEFDAAGLSQVKAMRSTMAGDVPMHTAQTILALTSVLQGLLVSTFGGQVVKTETVEGSAAEGNNGDASKT